MKLMRAWIVLLSIASIATAQPLAEYVPSSSVIYFGWRGSNDPGPAFAGSRTEAILNESQITKRWGKVFDMIIDQAKAELPKYAPELDAIKNGLPKMIEHPGALFIDVQRDATFYTPRAGLIVRVGTGSKDLVNELNLLVKSVDLSKHLRIQEEAGYVAILYQFGAKGLEELRSLKPAESLATRENYKRSSAALSADPFVTLYIDIDNGLAAGFDALKFYKVANDISIAEKIVDEAGISGLHSVGFSGGFVGGNWEENTFVDAPAPRHGLISLLEGKPLNAELMKRIPASTVTFSANRFDFLKLLNEVKRVGVAANPIVGEYIDKGLGVATLAVGKNIVNDVLDPLGDEWVYYRSPDVGPDVLRQMVLVTKLDNAFKAKQGLGALWLFMTNTVTAFVPKDKLMIKNELIRDNELSIYSVSLPGCAPSWTTKDGFLYLAFDVKTLKAAARYSGKGILENESAGKVISGLPSEGVIGVSYTDIPRDLPAGHDLLRLSIEQWRTAIREGAKKGATTNFVVPVNSDLLPSLDVLQKHVSPGGSVSWGDSAGLHAKVISPFPGAMNLSSQVDTHAIAEAIRQIAQPFIPAAERNAVPTTQFSN